MVVQERDGNNLPLVSYTRGNDLRGSFQGAAGIGGLLARTDHTTITPTHSYYHADGGGNVTALVNDKQLPVARYEYDPFGNTLSKSGPLADANTYRFSSQEYHQNTGLLLYLYRPYDANLQRFLNRDPMEELGGINLYGFVGNNPLDRVDLWGLDGRDDKDEADKILDRALLCGTLGGGRFTQAQKDETTDLMWQVGKAVPKAGVDAACMMLCPLGEAGSAGKGLRSAEKAAADASKMKNIENCAKALKKVNWKSVKQFGHTFSQHGAKRSVQSLIDRARAIYADGSIGNAGHAILVPVPGGGLRTAFPIP